MAVLRLSDAAIYLDRLRTEQSEPDRLLETISINVSSFFRDPAVWEAIAQGVIPGIIERKQASRSREIRVWSAGCASGEEAYSVAILFHQALAEELTNWKVHIFATDLSEQALKTATLGRYPRERLEHTRLGVLDEYFSFDRGAYEIRPSVRRMVWFSRDDLTSNRLAPADSIYGTFDLVLCRNVLIYFARSLQSRVLDKLTRTIARRGFLVLGESEIVEKINPYGLSVVDRRNRIYQNVEDPSTSSTLLPTGDRQHA